MDQRRSAYFGIWARFQMFFRLQIKIINRNNKGNNPMWININKDPKFQPQNKHTLRLPPKKSMRTNKTHISTQPSEIQQKAIIGSKVMLYSKPKKILAEQRNQNNQHQRSNFQILKRKISLLQNEKPLGNYSIRYCAKLHQQTLEAEYIPHGEFLSSKKLSVFEKYKLKLKNHHKKRKLSHHLITNNPASSSILHESLPQRVETQSCQLIKRRQNSSHCAKRYFGGGLYKQNIRYCGLGSELNSHLKNGSSLSLVSLH